MKSKTLRVDSLRYFKRGQLKVQEMAFVIVAFMIFFTLAALFFISIRTHELGKSVQSIREDGAREQTYRLSATPEIAWSACSGCVDLDKAFIFKQQIARNSSELPWNLDYLVFERVYPAQSGGECTAQNYPACNKTTVVKSKENFGITSATYVSLCQWDAEIGGESCALGRVYASAREVSSP